MTGNRRPTGYSILILGFCFWLATCPAFGALLYQDYIIRRDNGVDILCDPYVVKKNDWVIKVFKQKGEIAHKDFPEFLGIFKRINPHIRNIDRIRPGQQVLIPLKKLNRGAMPGQNTGIVRVPFVTVSNPPKDLKAHSIAHTVKRGETVSLLVKKSFGADSFQEGMKRFKTLNPRIADPNRIFIGQTIHLPTPPVQQQPEVEPAPGGPVSPIANQPPIQGTPPESRPNTPPPPRRSPTNQPPAIQQVASILDARLLDRGIYYFPQDQEDTLQLDLSRFPVLERKNGAKVLFTTPEQPVPKAKLSAIRSHWKALDVVPATHSSSIEDLLDAIFNSNPATGDNTAPQLAFSDLGIKVTICARWIQSKLNPSQDNAYHLCITPVASDGERTPASIFRYLRQHDIVLKEILKTEKIAHQHVRPAVNSYAVVKIKPLDMTSAQSAVQQLMKILGQQYTENVTVRFPYAGMEIETLSNLASLDNGSLLLVDFGNLYGDAAGAIEEMGFEIVQIQNGESNERVIQKVLGALKLSYRKNPDFFAARRSGDYNTQITIPGFLVSGRDRTDQLLFAMSPLNNEITQFLNRRNISVVSLIER